jgi:hypothetical protein
MWYLGTPVARPLEWGLDTRFRGARALFATRHWQLVPQRSPPERFFGSSSGATDSHSGPQVACSYLPHHRERGRTAENGLKPKLAKDCQRGHVITI